MAKTGKANSNEYREARMDTQLSKSVELLIAGGKAVSHSRQPRVVLLASTKDKPLDQL